MIYFLITLFLNSMKTKYQLKNKRVLLQYLIFRNFIYCPQDLVHMSFLLSTVMNSFFAFVGLYSLKDITFRINFSYFVVEKYFIQKLSNRCYDWFSNGLIQSSQYSTASHGNHGYTLKSR